MNSKTRILILEDRSTDAELVLYELKRHGFEVEWTRVENEKTYLAELDKQWDIILADYNLPEFDGLRALKLRNERSPDIPFIIVSGRIGEENAAAAMKSGATDFVMKDKLGRLGPAVERELRDAVVRRERKQAEQNQQLVIHALRLLNRANDLTALVQELVALIKNTTDYDAVGLRLREGEDFPYFVTDGFSEDFVRTERYLCARNADGEVMHDEAGKPVLECMCGNILCARSDPSKPFYSKGGSFWTNSTSELPSTSTDADLRALERYRCNMEGYESVALIPLRSGDEVIGLLQFNDRRPGRFTLELIQFYEGLAESIGIALKRGQAEEEIQKSEKRYRDFFEGDLSGDFSSTPDGDITMCNPAFAKMFGYDSVEELLEINSVDLYESPEQRSQFLALIRERGKIEFMESALRKRNGESITVMENVIGEFDEQGELVLIKGYLLDITERKRAERDLIHAKEQAEKANKLKDAFIANISHEIRTPLNIILGYTEIIESTYASAAADEERFFFDSVREGAERLMRTVDLILNTSRVGIGDVVLSLKEVDLPAFVMKGVRDLIPRAEEKSITLSVVNTAGDIIVIVDELVFWQVLVNLLDNAIKYTVVGSVTIELYRKEKDVYLDVRDTGVGIASEFIEHAFESYSQETIGYTRGYEGIGLGLALVKQYLSMHDIPISVQSEKGVGTTFTLCLKSVVKL